jgi:hypothetical protein
MHQLVILTALTASTGLFGGGKHHRGSCGQVAGSCYASAPMTGCGTTGYSYPAYSAPVAPAPQAAPAPQTAPMVHPTAYTAPSYYYPPSACAGGNCYRR